MAEFVKVAKIGEIKDGEGKVVAANGLELALFRQNGQFFAFDNTCLHMGGPLGEGTLEDDFVTCPWHGWRYNIKNGQNDLDETMKLKTYKTKVQGDDVLVEV